MLQFTEKCNKRIESVIIEITQSELNSLKRNHLIIKAIEKELYKLKEFIIKYSFKNKNEEIYFFKKIKPRLFSKLLYYRNVYKIEINLPNGSNKTIEEYYYKELDKLKDYYDFNKEFINYFRSDANFLDEIYFIRETDNCDIVHEYFFMDRDPRFFTIGDVQVSKMLANNQLEKYLNNKIGELINNDENNDIPKVRLTWTGSKIDLIELIYAIDTIKCINNGNINLKQIKEYFEIVFNLDIGPNISRAFYDMRIRKDKTPFLDKLREHLSDRIDEE